MSQYIKTWKKGDTVFWRGPFGGFPYRPNKVSFLRGIGCFSLWQLALFNTPKGRHQFDYCFHDYFRDFLGYCTVLQH